MGAVDWDDLDTDFSNYGPCLDLYAPGAGIVSTNHLGGSGVSKDGTSMASAHVAGAAALYWDLYPHLSGAQVQNAVLAQATSGVIVFPYGQSESPNLNLNVQFPVPTPPGAPGAVTASAHDGSATVSWSPPPSDGGNLITGYTVVTSTGQPGCSTGATSCEVTGLTNGAFYQFAVTAHNARGSSALSDWSAPVVPAGAPSAPRKVKVTARKGKAKVSWVRPAFDGGSAITGYTVFASPGSRRCGSSGHSCTVKRLKHRKRYRFTVVAYNAVGEGVGKTSGAIRIK